MRVLILILLLLTGCAGPQVSRPDANPLPPTDQYVEDVVHLLDVVAGTTSPERKAEAMAMLGDEELGRNFAYEARLKAEELKTRYDTVLLMETIGLFATYNPYVQQHRAELELDLCRTITPKVATGEIWLTAGNSNYESCLKDRQYVEAVVNNTLKGIQQYDSNEEQALQALLKRIPFTDIMAAARKNKKTQIDTAGINTAATTPVATAAHEVAENSKPKISLLVIPDGYDSFRWELETSMRAWPRIEYKEDPDDETIMIIIKINEFDSISGPQFDRSERYRRDECDDKIAKRMEKYDYYLLSYTESKKLWTFSGTFTIRRGSSAATESFSLDFSEKIVNCTYSRISHKKGATEIRDYANKEMERLCTKDSKEFTLNDVQRIFGGIFARGLAKNDWK